MNKPIFKILKYSYYTGGKKNLGQFVFSMGGNKTFFCTKEELIDLQGQITLALNDQKEGQNEK